MNFQTIDLCTSFSTKCTLINRAVKIHSPLLDIRRPDFGRREILSLPVQCTNHKDGCDWKGELRHFEVRTKTALEIVCLTLSNELYILLLMTRLDDTP